MEFQVSSHLFISDLMNIILKKKKIPLFQDTLYKEISLKSKQKYTSCVSFNIERGKIYCLVISAHSSSKNRLNTKVSISVAMITLDFFFLTCLSISTMVGLLLSQRWLNVSVKLNNLEDVLAPPTLNLLIHLFRASSPSSLRSPSPNPSFISILSQLCARILWTEGLTTASGRFQQCLDMFSGISL